MQERNLQHRSGPTSSRYIWMNESEDKYQFGSFFFFFVWSLGETVKSSITVPSYSHQAFCTFGSLIWVYAVHALNCTQGQTHVWGSRSWSPHPDLKMVRFLRDALQILKVYILFFIFFFPLIFLLHRTLHRFLGSPLTSQYTQFNYGWAISVEHAAICSSIWSDRLILSGFQSIVYIHR